MSEKSYVGMSNCFFCNQPKELLLNRRLRDTLPREAVYNHEPCQEFAGFMKQGVIFISVRNGESGDNPYRTGGWWVIKEDAVKRMITDQDMLADVLARRVCFVEDEICEKIGLRKANDP